jgi:hypothetical protein
MLTLNLSCLLLQNEAEDDTVMGFEPPEDVNEMLSMMGYDDHPGALVRVCVDIAK